MKIIVNDREFNFESVNLNITSLLEQLKIQQDGIAVCVNGDIVRKKGYADYKLKDGDKIDIITMVGGG